MTTDPAEAGRLLAEQTPPLTDEQIEEGARIIAAHIREQQQDEAA